MGKIVMTVKGPVDPSELGFTLVHEHLITQPPDWWARKDPDFVLDSIPKALAELGDFASAGGGTLVECTAIDYGRNAKALLEIANRTHVKLIAVTGFNRGLFCADWVHKSSVDDLAGLMVKDVVEGIEGTSVRANLIKIGTDYNFMRPVERKIIQAAGQAHERTGATICTHTTRGTLGLEQIEALEKAGVPPSRVILAHLDQNPDFGYLCAIAETGAHIQFDGPSKVKYYPDSVRIGLLRRLTGAGYLTQLLVSGDMGRQSYLRAYGGGPGFTYIPKKFIPRLLREGFTQEEVDIIFVKNPSRILAFEPRFPLSTG